MHAATTTHSNTAVTLNPDAPATAARWIVFGLPVAFCGIFLGSATVSAFISYDRPAALLELALLGAGVLFCLLCIGLAATAGDSSLWNGYVPVAIGLFCIAALLLLFGLQTMRPAANGGPLAGAVATLLPLCALSLSGRTSARPLGWLLGAATILVAALSVMVLLAVDEPSAVAAIGIGVLAATGWAALPLPRPWMALLALGVVAILTLPLLAPSLSGRLLVAASPLPAWAQESLSGRLSLWNEASPLFRDYRLSGSGLASTNMVFAAYSLLTHVPYTSHLHSLFLQVGMEQGMFGSLALAGLFALALAKAATVPQRSRRQKLLSGAILASLIATLALGVVDSELLTSALAAVLFVPVGLALALQSAADEASGNTGWTLALPDMSVAVVTIVLFLALPVALVLPGIRSLWDSNRAAIEQTRIELGDYDPAVWLHVDAVRRARRQELEPAVVLYRSALAADPENETAHRRLGQIDLTMSEFDQAFTHMLEAYRLDPGNRATRQLLGELYALRGDANTAVELWSPLDLGERQLETRIWWYRYLDDRKAEVALTDALQMMEAGAGQ